MNFENARVSDHSRRSFLRAGATFVAGGSAGLFVPSREAHALTAQQGAVILSAARAMIGTPYRIPPSPNYQAPPYPRPQNIDCSMLTQWCYWQANLFLKRTAAWQFGQCTYSTNMPGALVFFRGTVANRPNEITHVGINVGNGWMVDANSVRGVVEERWYGDRYWMNYFAGCGTF